MTAEYHCLTDGPQACWAFTDPPVGFEPLKSLAQCDTSLLGLCLVVPPEQDGGIFGFAEFVQAFALLVLVYTMSDVRYRFRASTAPINIYAVTFWLSGFIGLGTLLTDLWFTKRYPIPSFLTSQAYWQFAFGLLFVSVVMLWLWYAFVRPPTFGHMNPQNFARQIYLYLLQGDEKDLPVIAGELRRSAWNLIKYAVELPHRGLPPEFQQPEPKLSRANECAHDILLLIGSRKFCRHIVASAPITAIAFFQAMSAQKKYRLPIGQFASNVTSEALLNKDSAIYHEDEGYYSGYLGYMRPFTNAVYGDFRLVEALTEGSSPLDIDLDVRWGMDRKQLEAFCRAALTTLKSALKAGSFYNHSYAIFRALHVIEYASADVYKLNDTPEGPEAKEIRGRLSAVVHFVNDAIKAFDEDGVKQTRRRHRGEEHRWHKDLYDHLADLMFEVILHVSSLKSPGYDHWTIQYSTVWSAFFSHDDTPVRRIILFKLRRLLYEEVLRLEKFPNFKSGPLLGYLLNVMGVKIGPKKEGHRFQEYQLRKAVVNFARQKYLWLVMKQHRVAASVVFGSITFDANKKRLVKTYNEGLSLKAPQDYLDLVPVPPAAPRTKKPKAPKQRKTTTTQ